MFEGVNCVPPDSNRENVELQCERKIDEQSHLSLSLSGNSQTLQKKLEQIGIVSRRVKRGCTGIFLRWDSYFRECGPDSSGSGGNRC